MQRETVLCCKNLDVSLITHVSAIFIVFVSFVFCKSLVFCPPSILHLVLCFVFPSGFMLGTYVHVNQFSLSSKFIIVRTHHFVSIFSFVFSIVALLVIALFRLVFYVTNSLETVSTVNTALKITFIERVRRLCKVKKSCYFTLHIF